MAGTLPQKAACLDLRNLLRYGHRMNRWFLRILLLLLCCFAFPFRSPAPLIFVPGEGWTYEMPGDKGGWRRETMREQIAVAQQAFDGKKYGTALKAARRVVKYQKGLSDYAPQAQYLIGRCYEAKGNDEKAFNAYQQVLEKYPKIEYYPEILQRQFQIAGRYLGGKWFKRMGILPYHSMEKTAVMYTKIIKNGPYSEIAPQAQMNIGAAREKESKYPLAVKAYERAADRYNDRPEVASEAVYKAGLAYNKEAKTAEYDQSVAAQAIATFTDFIALYPDDARVPEAQKIINSMKTEQARGSFKTAKFYEKKKKWDGALIYYNEVLLKDPESRLATTALERIDTLKKRAGQK